MDHARAPTTVATVITDLAEHGCNSNSSQTDIFHGTNDLLIATATQNYTCLPKLPPSLTSYHFEPFDDNELGHIATAL